MYEMEVSINTEVLKYNLCDQNDACILAKGDVTTAVAPATQVSFKNCALPTNSITKNDGTTTDDAEDLDFVMAMYDLTKYSSNYSTTLLNYQ